MYTRMVRKGVEQWMHDPRWTHFLTLCENRETTLSAAERHFRTFCACVDECFLGRRYSSKPDLRQLIVVFPEHLESNLHFHGMMEIKPSKRVPMSEVEAVLLSEWKKVVVSGSIDVQKIYDASGLARYMTKELKSQGSDYKMLMSNMYWPS